MSTKISLEEQIAEIGRELGMRKGAYPRFVAQGRFTEEEAAQRIAAMDAVYATLKWLQKHRVKVLEGIEAPAEVAPPPR